jgi:hypothetical protein
MAQPSTVHYHGCSCTILWRRLVQYPVDSTITLQYHGCSLLVLWCVKSHGSDWYTAMAFVCALT